MFPNINNINFDNTIHLINLNYNSKKLWFYVKYTKKNLNLLSFCKKLNLIDNFLIIKKNNNFFFLIKLFYWKKKKVIKNYKSFTKNFRKFYISLKALRLIFFKKGSSEYIISTSIGLLTLTDCLKYRKGGYLIGAFYN